MSSVKMKGSVSFGCLIVILVFVFILGFILGRGNKRDPIAEDKWISTLKSIDSMKHVIDSLQIEVDSAFIEKQRLSLKEGNKEVVYKYIEHEKRYQELSTDGRVELFRRWLLDSTNRHIDTTSYY